MKNLIFIVLLAVVAIAGYSYVNQQKETDVVATAAEEVSNDVVIDESTTATEVKDEDINLITPADMTEEAQAEMYKNIMEYNKCMLQNRLEYHQQGVRTEDVADKTLTACEPHLDELKATLTANNVNSDLREGMVKTMRQRAARKLMSTIMQSMAGQAAAAANVPTGTVTLPVEPAPVPVTP